MATLHVCLMMRLTGTEQIYEEHYGLSYSATVSLQKVFLFTVVIKLSYLYMHCVQIVWHTLSCINSYNLEKINQLICLYYSANHTSNPSDLLSTNL